MFCKPSLGVCLATQEYTAMNGGSPGKLIQILEFDFGKSELLVLQ
jgi:hypothetical protein